VNIEPQQDSVGMLMLHVGLSRLGSSRRGDLNEITTGADKELLRLGKRLLACEETKAIRKFDSKLMGWIRARSVPSLFKAGIYHIHPTAAEEIDAYLNNADIERYKMVAALRAVYIDRREADRVKLGPQFNEEDYPSAEQLESEFSLSWRFFSLAAPEEILETAPQLFRREKERVGNLIEEAREQGMAMMRGGFAKLVNHLVEKLTPDDDGKRKRFYGSNIDNIVEFIDTFRMRDIADDAQLREQLDKASQLLRGVDPSVLKDETFDGLRDEVREGFAEIQTSMGGMVGPAPVRKIDPEAF